MHGLLIKKRKYATLLLNNNRLADVAIEMLYDKH